MVIHDIKNKCIESMSLGDEISFHWILSNDYLKYRQETYRVHKIKTITVDCKWLLTLKSLDFSYGNLKWFETQKAFRVIVPNVQRMFKEIKV